MKWRIIESLLGLSLFMCIPALAADYVVQVGPPTGPDDTGLIQSALDECVHQHSEGCTVQLDAGTYMIQQLFAEDFHGTFKGKGMDVTILQGLPNLDVSQEVPIWASLPSICNKYPMLVLFFGGDIAVSDMTISALEPKPTAGWYDYEDQTEPFTTLWAILEFMGQSEEMNVAVTRVALKGVYDESQPAGDHYNSTGLSIDPWPAIDYPTPGYLSGTFRVTACRIDTGFQGILAAALHDARLIIGGSPSEANHIRNCEFATWLLDLDSSVTDFSYNDIGAVGPYAWGAFAAYQGWVVPIETPSSFLIQHNRVRATGGLEDGIWVMDLAPFYREGKTGNFVISNNDITLEPSNNVPAGDGIESAFTEGTIISNNRVLGSGYTGIALWGDTQAVVKGNDIGRVTVVAESYYPAPMSLQNFDPVPVNNCTVVGFGNKTDVYYEGENNTLVGVNNMQGNPPGPPLRDAMKRKMEMIKSMRKP